LGDVAQICCINCTQTKTLIKKLNWLEIKTFWGGRSVFFKIQYNHFYFIFQKTKKSLQNMYALECAQIF